VKFLCKKKLHFGVVCIMAIVLSMTLSASVHSGTGGLIKIEQAKVKFSAKDYKGALLLLEEAILDVSDNGDAHHYAGLCEMALGNEDDAIKYFEMARALKPEDSGAQTDTAWAAIETGDYKLAQEASKKALEIDSGNARARYLQGRAVLGQKEYETAYSIFQAVGTSEEYAQEGMFYSGLCLLKMGREEDANNSFKAAQSVDPDSPIGKEAARYLAGGGDDGKPWSVRLRLLYQYDSNILPAKDEDSLPLDEDGDEVFDDLDDYRFVTDIDARYNFLREENYGAQVRWVGYASFHAEEDQLNLLYNMAEVSSYYDIDGDVPVKLASAVDYAIASIDGDAYSSIVQVSPEIFAYWTDSVVTRVKVDYMSESFDEDTVEELGGSIADEDDRDNTKVVVSLTQHLFTMDNNVNLWAGYSWGKADADGDHYNRVDNTAVLGMIALLPMDAMMALVYKYEVRDYTDSGEGDAKDREDYVNQVNFSVQAPVYEWANIYAGMVFRNVESQWDEFEYERIVYTLGLLADL
jgi:tetratricopeptide (TPR) repeat protein